MPCILKALHLASVSDAVVATINAALQKSEGATHGSHKALMMTSIRLKRQLIRHRPGLPQHVQSKRQEE